MELIDINNEYRSFIYAALDCKGSGNFEVKSNFENRMRFLLLFMACIKLTNLYLDIEIEKLYETYNNIYNIPFSTIYIQICFFTNFNLI